ncbi:MAG TPA: T9SS type A sorting domain-containing protein [Saprospiraceae bacterium]|nr:T9SS type A sorting domain-containing protein [Saprospiraceae bacterium]
MLILHILCCPPPDIYLEVNVVLKQNPDLLPSDLYNPNAEKVFIRHTYLVNQIEGVIDDVAHLGNIKSYEVIGNLTLTEDMTIYAWSTIEITGTIVTNGHKLTLIAGNEISGNISDLPDGVDLIIGNPAGCGDAVPPQTPTEISGFCHSNKYNPVEDEGRPGNPQGGNIGQTPKSKSYLSVSPNPFQDYFKISYQLEEEKEVLGFLRNSLGEVVRKIKLEGGENEKEVIVASGDLPTGIYFLTIQTESDLKTVKLIKQAE